MRLIAILNEKGGTGKTTTAVNLAACLAEQGKRVLLIDLDKQKAATKWFGLPDGGGEFVEALQSNGDIGAIAVNTSIEGIDMIPGSAHLSYVEKRLMTEIAPEFLLKRCLDRYPLQGWDYVLFDCHSNIGLMTLNVMAVADELLVPVEAHYLAVEGLAELLKTVTSIQDKLNQSLRIEGILACRVDSRTRHCPEVVRMLKDKMGELFYNTIIRENVRLAECPSHRIPITQYDPKSAGTNDYRLLAEEFLFRHGDKGREVEEIPPEVVENRQDSDSFELPRSAIAAIMDEPDAVTATEETT